MKKIILIMGLIVISFFGYISFASGDYSNGTLVEYVGTGSESYSVVVPAKLAPGDEGVVELYGTWGSNHAINVTSDESVDLVNSLNSNDKRTLDVFFDGISAFGDDSKEQFFDNDILVDEMPSDVLFGTWSGKFNYYVEMKDKITFQCNAYYYNVPEGMTFADYVDSEYNDGYDIDGNETSRFMIEEDSNGDLYVTLEPGGMAALYYLDAENNYKVLTPDVVITEGFHCFVIV